MQSPLLKRGINGATIPNTPCSPQTADASAQSQALVFPEKDDNNSKHSHQSQHSIPDQLYDEKQSTPSHTIDSVLSLSWTIIQL